MMPHKSLACSANLVSFLASLHSRYTFPRTLFPHTSPTVNPHPHVSTNAQILTHSYSRTVMKTLLRASRQHKRIRVYVTEAKPDSLGHRTYDQLTAANIPCTLVLDSAVAYVMERVDMVLVGSEAVVESGASCFSSSFPSYHQSIIVITKQPSATLTHTGPRLSRGHISNGPPRQSASKALLRPSRVV